MPKRNSERRMATNPLKKKKFINHYFQPLIFVNLVIINEFAFSYQTKWNFGDFLGWGLWRRNRNQDFFNLLLQTYHLKINNQASNNFLSYWVCVLLSMCTTEYVYYWIRVLLSMCTTEYMYYWACVLLSTCTTEYMYYWVRVLLSMCTTEHVYYWVHVLLSTCTTEYVYYWACVLLITVDEFTWRGN